MNVEQIKLKLSPLNLLDIATLCRSQFILPVLFLLYQENGLTVGDYLLFNGICSIAALVFQAHSGYISDFFSKKNILLLSFLLLLLRTILWMSFRGYFIILIGEILAVLSKTFYSGVADSYVYEYLKFSNQSRKMLSKYGKLNFFLSVGTAITSIAGAFFYSRTGFNVLLLIDFLLLSFAIVLILLLPKLEVAHKKTSDLKHIYKKLFEIIRITMRNKKINVYILFASFLTAASLTMAFLFQPLMQISKVPVFMFGIVYFVNYSLRAASGILATPVGKIISLKKLAFISYLLFCASFILIALAFFLKNMFFTLFCLFFICITIMIEFMFSISSISFIHTKIYTKYRSAISSVNFMISKLISAFVLISFKFILSLYTVYVPIIIFGILFLLTFPLLTKRNSWL